MLKFNMCVRKKPFVLIDGEGLETQAVFTQFTVEESTEIRKLLSDKKDLDVIDFSDLINKTRVIHSVKTDSGIHVYDSIDSLNDMPVGVVEAMMLEVDKLNPWPKIDETLDSKKN